MLVEFVECECVDVDVAVYLFEEAASCACVFDNEVSNRDDDVAISVGEGLIDFASEGAGDEVEGGQLIVINV